jgi:mannan endo-1,4-beta-mannosidase
MQDWIREVHRMGGVNTVSWHMVNPVRDSNSWDTARAVETILPGGVHHEKFKTWLDRFVAFNRALVLDGEAVPLIFRPWHEWNGDWFWWGRRHSSTEEFISLWRFTIQYLRDRGVHNLLYAFSPDVFASRDQYLERYPGDDWVDILGFDDYQGVRTAEAPAPTALAGRIKTVVRLARDRGKIAALTETGVEGIPMATWFTDVLLPALREGAPDGGLSWVLVWRNAFHEDKPGHHYGPYAGHPSASDCLQFRQDPRIYFLQDMKKAKVGQRGHQ